MNRTRVVRTILIPAIIALLATAGLYSALSSRATVPEKIPVVTGQVVAAATAIPSRTVITKNMVTIKEVPLAYITPGTVRTVEAVVGRVALVPLGAGEILMTSNVTGTAQGASGLSYAIPSGKRAITVQIDEISGVAGFPLVGDRVDLLWTAVGVVVGQQTTENRTRLLVEDLEILAVVQNPTLGGDSGAARDLKGYTSVTLEVTPEQAATIALAESLGRLRMILRPAVDADWVGEFELRSSGLLGAVKTISLSSDRKIGLEVRVLELDVSALASLGFSGTGRGIEHLSAWQLSQINGLIENGRGRVLDRASLSANNRVNMTYRWMGQALPTGGGDAYPAPYGLSLSAVPSFYGLSSVSIEASVRLQMVDVPVDGRSLTGNAISSWGFARPQLGEGLLVLGLASPADLQPPSGGGKRMVLPGNVSADLLSGKRTLLMTIVPSF